MPGWLLGTFVKQTPVCPGNKATWLCMCVANRAAQREPRAKGSEGNWVSRRLRADSFYPEQLSPGPHPHSDHTGGSRHQGPQAMSPKGLQETRHKATRTFKLFSKRVFIAIPSLGSPRPAPAPR